MPKIHLTTFINAPVERVFDLSRNLAVFKKIINIGKEQILSDTNASCIGKGETITFKAKHLGKLRVITTKVVELQLPGMYKEEQVKGDLKSFTHQHHFKTTENGTIMIDLVDFEGPKDLLGSIAGKFYLKNYIEAMLKKKNELIRDYAETDKWRAVLS
jgi:ligand-binding SRPBCC domain-containing protein